MTIVSAKYLMMIIMMVMMMMMMMIMMMIIPIHTTSNLTDLNT